MIYRSKTNNKLRVLLGLLGMISLLWLCPNITRTIALSPPRPYKTAPATIQASPLKVNGKIAFSSARNGFLDIYVMDVDGRNQRQLTFGARNPADGSTRTYTSGPVWSPDGTKIAFTGNLDYRSFNLNVMNADGTRIHSITNGIDVDTATWSPDGKKLAFSSACGSIEGLCPIDIYTVNADGTGLTNLTINPHGAQDVGPAWSPDGSRIAFSGVRDNEWTGIYVMNPDGSNRVRLTSTQANDHSSAWSPDGTKIAFERNSDAFGVVSDVYVMNADGSNQTPVTTGGKVDTFEIAWSPDGTKILFVSGRLRSNAEVYVINSDGTNQRNISNNPGDDYLGSWQPLFISTTNSIDDAQFFVHQHYDDFLSREPDPSGLAFWTNEITSCASDAKCIDLKRQNVSAAYFLSTEFQETGYLVYRFYNAALNRANAVPRFIEFMRDTQRVADGVIVNADGWQQLLEQNKQAFAQDFVARPEFTALYPDTMSPTQFVDALYQHAGITPTTAERQAALDEFNTPTGARGRVMRRVAENQTLYTREFNRAFVLMQYFGYLRRNPDDPPDNNVNGYNFWLGKLNQFGGNYQAAEMVKAFIVSSEYRQRFGP